MSDIIILDTETGVHNRGDEAVGKMKASPWHPKNKIEYFGKKNLDDVDVKIYHSVQVSTAPIKEPKHPRLLVGQNIKFDLHYLMKDWEGFREYAWPTCQIWDTMLAEYLLTGQQSQYASLDKLAEKYGGTLKNDEVKEFWDEGYMTEDIPEEIIIPYLQDDVLNTEIVFKEQVKKAKELGMLELIKVQMTALKATTEMEWNGMYFNRDTANSYKVDLAYECAKYISYCDGVASTLIHDFYTKNGFNVGSSAHISLVLFGGEYKYKEDKPVCDEHSNPIRYKSGKKKGLIKTKKVEVVGKETGYNIKIKEEYKTPSGKISTSDGVLKDILKGSHTSIGAYSFIEHLLMYRKLAKDISTYFEGYSKLVWPDGIIHHTLNHVGTDTGRLSSSNPNLQNVSSKEED